MKARERSWAWFKEQFGEDMYQYHENRFLPVVGRYLDDAKGLILDAACGSGNPYLARLKLERQRLVGADIDPSVRHRNKLHERFLIQDLHEFRSEDRFGAVFSLYTWEHLHSPARVLARFRQALLSSGLILIIAPQKGHFISILERLLPLGLKDFAWRILKGTERMPYPSYYRLCSYRELRKEASRQGFRVEHYEALEGPALWFAVIPPLFVLQCLMMRMMNAWRMFEPMRSTFLAVLRKLDPEQPASRAVPEKHA